MSPNKTLGPTSWPLTLTPERSTATQSNTVRLWCSLVISFKKVSQDREQSVGHTHTQQHSRPAAHTVPWSRQFPALYRVVVTRRQRWPTCTRGAVPHSHPWVFTVAFTAVHLRLNRRRASIGMRLHDDPASAPRCMQPCVCGPFNGPRRPESGLHCEVYAASLHGVQLN